MRIDLPSVPRVRRTSTGGETENFYVNLFKSVFKSAASSLLCRYQSCSFQVSNALQRLLEDPDVIRAEMEEISLFYGNWNMADDV